VLTQSGSQTVGPFFRKAMERPAWSDLTSADTPGERIRIGGRVLDGDGQPVPDAWLEIWQANAIGKYAHPDDTQAKSVDPNFRGFGRACTDESGTFAFTTVRPGSVPMPDGTPQAPHISLTIFARGLLKRLATRIYFADCDAANASDPIYAGIADRSARETLLARSQAPGEFVFDVILQGTGETTFFSF